MSNLLSANSPVLSVVLITRHPQETPDAVLGALASEIASLDQPALVEVIFADGRPNAGSMPATVPEPFSRLERPKMNMPRLKAEGLACAQGRHVAFLEPKAVPVSGWLPAAIDAITQHPRAALGGAVIQAPGAAADRAAYAFEYAAFSISSLSQGQSVDLPGNNMILPTEELRNYCGDILSGEGLNKPFCQSRLKGNGVPVVLIPGMAVELRTHYGLGSLLASRFNYARCFGGTRVAFATTQKRWAYRLGAPVVPALLLYRHIARNFRTQGYDRLDFCGLVALSVLCIVWAAGEAAGSCFGAGKSCDKLY